MSPVQQTRLSPRTIVIMAISAVIIAAGLLVFVLVSLPRLTSSGEVEVQLGSELFDAGYATVQAAAIDGGGPILYSDVSGGQRDIYLQHLGDDPLSGWVAFDARRAGTARECTVQWDPADEQFDDPCDGSTVPADGAGLTAVFVEVRGETGEERIVIDLNEPVTTVGTTGSTTG